MHILLYFGSYNPIHTGHLIIAETARQTESIDQVWLVVSPQNPFKQQEEFIPEQERFNMVQLALEGNPNLRACDIEFGLPRPSYTIDTLAALKEKYPDDTFSLLVGADNLEGLPRWKSFEEIINNHSIYIYKRHFDYTKRPIEHHNFKDLEGPLLDLSATHIRELIKEGKSIKYLVPDVIEDLLMKKIT